MVVAAVVVGMCVAVISAGPTGVRSLPLPAGQRGGGSAGSGSGSQQLPVLPPVPGYIPVYIQSGDSPPDVQRLYEAQAQRTLPAPVAGPEEPQRSPPTRRATLTQVGDASQPAPAIQPAPPAPVQQQPRVPRPQDPQRTRPAAPAPQSAQEDAGRPRTRLASTSHAKDADPSRITKKGGAVPAADAVTRRPSAPKRRTGPSQYRAPNATSASASASQRQRQEQLHHQRAAQTRKRQQQQQRSSSTTQQQEPQQPQR